MKIYTFLLSALSFALLLVQASFASPVNAFNLQVDKDITYIPPAGGDRRMSKFDVYYPGNSSGKRLLVFVHGGSWVGGDKRSIEKARGMIPWFISRGYVVAAPNFRLASPPRLANGISYTKQARDIAHSIAAMKKRAIKYGVTKPGIVLVGYSSGAHLVALLSSDKRYLQEVGLSLNDIAASISLDVHAYDVPYALKLMENSPLKKNIPLVKSVFGSSKSLQLAGSPVNYIRKNNVPPSLLISADVPHRSQKGDIAKRTTKRYAYLLNQAGHTAYAVHFDDETHSSLVMDFGRPGDGPTRVVSEFLRRVNL